MFENSQHLYLQTHISFKGILQCQSHFSEIVVKLAESSFQALPKTRLKPQFAHFCAFLNICEQNECQIRFSQPIVH